MHSRLVRDRNVQPLAFLGLTVTAPSLHITRARHSRLQVSARATLDPPPDAYITLGEHDQTHVCRLITALSSSLPHSPYSAPNSLQVTRAIDTLVEAGLQTFDLGCLHPRPSFEGMVFHAREYVRLIGPSLATNLRFCSQAEIDPHTVGNIHQRSVQKIVDQHLKTMGLERLDLLQLAWSDFRDKRYIDFLGELLELKRVGKIASIGTVAFPTRELKYLASQGISIASNQVSFSLVDRRALVDMADWCHSNRIRLLAKSALGAGFINERFLGLPEPSKRLCEYPPVAQFASVIRAWGGWSLFQELLYAIKQVADKHDVTMSNVAIKWALQSSGQTAVVIDASLEDTGIQHCVNNLRVFHFTLDDDDRRLLDSVASKCNDLHSILGDCGNELQPRSR